MSHQANERDELGVNQDLNDLPPPPPDTIRPLDGEAGIPSVMQATAMSDSWRRVGAYGIALIALLALVGYAAYRLLPTGKRTTSADSTRKAERPSAAATEPHQLDMAPAAPRASAPVGPIVPALIPREDEKVADPIGLRRTGSSAGTAKPRALPEDAPAMLLTTRPAHGGAQPSQDVPSEASPDATAQNGSLQSTQRNLQAYQRRLDGMLANLDRTANIAASRGGASDTAGSADAQVPAAAAPQRGLFAGQLQATATPPIKSALLGNRSLTLPKGTVFTCALKTKVVSATSGFVGCQVQRNVYSDDGRVLLIERGSHLDGEYRATSVRPGTVRIPILWSRVRTPQGVTIEVESPATGQLGESGVEGYVDNRWGERIGAAMLLSLIDDSVKLAVGQQTGDAGNTTVVMPSSTANASKLAEKVLDSTINIPPLIYQNQGATVGIYVAHDVDFSSVYELSPVVP